MIGCLSLNCVILLLGVFALEAHDSDALKHAQALEGEHRYNAAVEVYEELLKENNGTGRAHFLLGRLYLRRLREPGKAVAHLERACKTDPEVCECHFLLSEAYAGQFMSVGVVDKVVLAVKAKSAVDAAVKCDPRSVDYRKARIQYFLTIPGAGGYERAHAEADALAGFVPYAGLLVHASLYGYEGKGDRALEFFERAIASKPNDPMGYEWLGNYRLRQGRYEDAINVFERAVELSPYSASAFHDLGRAYQKNRQHEEAVQALDRAVNANSDSTEIAYDLARSYQLLGRTTEAVELYQRCLSLDDPHGSEADLARKRLTKLESTAQTAPARDDSVQEASPRFFGPVVLAYLLACGGWVILARLRVFSFRRDPFPTFDKPWRELAWAGIAVVGIFALGLAFRFGFLIPSGSGWLHHVSWTLNNVIIYSPIFILLATRKQTLETVFLSTTDIGRKSAAGGILAIVATVAFLGLRGELADLPGVLRGVVEPDNATNFLPVFLEGVVIAFLFVRVRWTLGFWPAILIPAVLFAVGHVPRQLASGDSVGTMMVDFAFNIFLPGTILYVVAQSRDVVWLGIVHYVMDIAIKAFE